MVIILIIVLCIVVVYVKWSHKKNTYAFDKSIVHDGPCANTAVTISPNPAYETMKSHSKDSKDYDYIKDDYLCIFHPHHDAINMESNPSYGFLKGTKSVDSDKMVLDVNIEPNPSYDEAKHKRKTDEDQYGYVEPNQFAPNIPISRTDNNTVKMEDNPSYGLTSRESNTPSQIIGSSVKITPKTKSSDYDYVHTDKIA